MMALWFWLLLVLADALRGGYWLVDEGDGFTLVDGRERERGRGWADVKVWEIAVCLILHFHLSTHIQQPLCMHSRIRIGTPKRPFEPLTVHSTLSVVSGIATAPGVYSTSPANEPQVHADRKYHAGRASPRYGPNGPVKKLVKSTAFSFRKASSTPRASTPSDPRSVRTKYTPITLLPQASSPQPTKLGGLRGFCALR